MTVLPTTDLYFLNACGSWVSRFLRSAPLRRLGKNCFATRDAVLLLRQDEPDLMRRLCTNPPGKLVYLIDDDIAAAAADASLPGHYRQRLERFRVDHHDRLVARADTLVVTSQPLLEKFAYRPDVRLLHPVWHLPAADVGHYSGIGRDALIHATHLGTGSHGAGLAFLKPVIRALLERHERFHFTYTGQEPCLGDLDGHRRVHRCRPQAWRRYRRTVRGRRAHLGLYPLPPTPFNRARSRNKVLEHAVIGAVGVYADSWPPARECAGSAILAGSDAAEWTATLSRWLEQPQELQPLAEAGRAAFAALNDPQVQRRFWAEVLGVSGV